jgi:hypothetical protein
LNGLGFNLKDSLKSIFNPKNFSRLLHIVRPTWDVISGPFTYNEDGMATSHNADILLEDRFARSYQAAKNTGSWPHTDLRWRVYVACWAAEKGMRLEGDFVECGVFRGGLAMAVAVYTDIKNCSRSMYLLDTFTGLSEKYAATEEQSVDYYMRKYDDIAGQVRETFMNYPNIKIIQGAVPETLSQVPSKKIAYLSLDMNSAVPEIAAAQYFWDKLVPGAVIVLDDYAYKGNHSRQKAEFDQFAAERSVSVLSMPTGQGLLFKP